MTDNTLESLMAGADMGDETEGVDELTLLKARADQLGIKYAHKIGLETLRKKITDKLTGGDDDEDEKEDAPSANAEGVTLTKTQREQLLRKEIMAEQMALVRLRITNLNPNKRLLHGEIFTVANAYIGIVKKFVPFGEVTEDGFHLPKCIYTQLKNRKFLDIKTTKDRKTGNINVSQRWVPEFALEVLPQLSAEELRDLAIAQATAGGV